MGELAGEKEESCATVPVVRVQQKQRKETQTAQELHSFVGSSAAVAQRGRADAGTVYVCFWGVCLYSFVALRFKFFIICYEKKVSISLLR